MFKQLSILSLVVVVFVDARICYPDETVKALVQLTTGKDGVTHTLRDKTSGIRIDEQADYIGIPTKAFESLEELVGQHSDSVDHFFDDNKFIFKVTVGRDSAGVRSRDDITLKTIDEEQWIIGQPLADSLCSGRHDD